MVDTGSNNSGYLVGRCIGLCLLLIFVPHLSPAQTSPHGKITIQCQACHATDSWEMRSDASFDHDKLRFPLTGQHKSVPCAACHADLKFEPAAATCATCHSDIHRNELGPDCVRCHTTQSWLVPDMIQKHQETQFPLAGRHQTADCQSCHPGTLERRFAGTPVSCVGCHLQDFQATTSPNHLAAGFTTDCETCHELTAFTWSRGFDHNVTGFPLSGAHIATACVACHQNQLFTGTPSQCVACHQADFASTTDPNHTTAGFSTDCQTCHTTASWGGAVYDHNLTSFPLTGSHRNQECQSCHGDNVYTGKPTDCYSCHQNDFVATQNPNHAVQGFSTDCQTCHTTSDWQPATFDHNNTAFPLTGDHAEVDCQSCHTNNNYQLVYTDCFQCHNGDFALPTDPNHMAGNFSHDCQPCHTTTAWLPSTFSHANTPFPLTGAHVAASCTGCHVNDQYQGLPALCNDCHVNDFNGTTNPNHATGGFSTDCVQCHTTTAWSPAGFDHNLTPFALTGAHVTTDCQSCHAGGNYQLVYTDCYQCHQSDFQSVQSPNHVTGNFSHDCTPCHSTAAWEPASFDHSQTAFPLSGAHVSATCQSCHVNGNYQLVYTDCYQCHQADFDGVVSPNHVTGTFSHDCTPCHSTTAWEPASFDHGQTAFPLSGAHVSATCQSCHVNGNYQLVYTDCYQCHQADFDGVVSPNHVTGNFSHDCTPCHGTTAWEPASFDHSQTAFPLSGAHVTATCQSCHVNGNYQLVFTDCYQCHQVDFDGVVSPNHVSGNFSHDCTPCHTTAAWEPASFDHSQTAFPLSGAHVSATCQSCHVNGNYQLVYADCYQCHQSDFAVPLEPNHVAGNFNHDCQPCHTTTAWLPSTFNHGTTTFPLTGAHQTVLCSQCHVNNQYQGLPGTCFDCHADDFNSVTNPNHVAGGFSTDCTTCHTTTAWQPATFDHSQTDFPLTGAHVTTDCQSCHINGNYQLVYTDCYQCHQSDYESVQSPNHVTGNFSHDCTPCHSTTAWEPASFDHSQTAFPLTGAHVTATCQSCHIDGNYQLVFTDCYQCHQGDFAVPLEPNHVAGNFDHDCQPCHTTTAWLPSTFSHNNTEFPLTGAHQAVVCSNCHVNNQYQGLSTVCYDCHSDDFNGTTNPNHVAGNFPTDCVQCHTTTAWSPASFDHNLTAFPLTGAHIPTPCQSCHIDGNYQLVFTDCYQCHASDYQIPTDPNHVLLQFSHDCTTCHTTTAWLPSTFDHDGQFFRIYSGAHREAWSSCSDCHPVAGDFTQFTCTTCHERAETDNQHSDVSGYEYSSPACYNCHQGVMERGRRLK